MPIIERALDLGVNYIDTSSIYGGPERWSEQYVGRVMARRRSEAFLATKTKERDRDGLMRMIETSLQLLQHRSHRLWQLHDIGIMANVDAVFAKGGAMEALPRDEGAEVVRHLGITGHYRPEPLMECIRRYPFDTILHGRQRRGPASLQLRQALLPTGRRAPDGDHRHEDPGRSALLSSWTPPSIEAQKHSWEGMSIANVVARAR